MDSIINSIVSIYLADYLEINLEKTKTSILSGTVELSGVKFKRNLFATLNLPYLELEDGFIGKIKIKLSLPRFYLNPIILIIDKIYIKVRPKDVNKISEDDIINTYEVYKQKKLKEFEELMNIKFSVLFEEDQKSANKKNGMYKMVENIVNNIHIDIGKIVIIFDDCISSPENPFTLGITLEKLYIESTSKDFKKLKDEDKSSIFKYKKLSLKNLNIFLDKIKPEDIIIDEKKGEIIAYHKIINKEEKLKKLNDKEKNYLKDSLNYYLYCESEINEYSKDKNYHSYLLRELNLDIKLIINEKFEENKEPIVNAIIETYTITTEITNKQIESMINILNYISLKDLFQQNTIENYYKLKEKIDDDTVKKYREDYSLYYKTKYIEIYKNEKENMVYLENMRKVERNLRIDNIKALREMGNDIINNIIEIGKIDKEIKEKESGWLKYFKSKKNINIEKLKSEREKKIQEQKKIQEKNSTMNQFKNYFEDIFKKAENQNLEEDNTQLIFKFIMNEFVLSIKEDKKNEIKELFVMNFELFECEILMKSISQYIKFSLKDMTIKQYLSLNPEYQNILFSKPKKENNEVQDNNINIIKEQNNNLLLIEFEHNNLFPISPFKFKLHFGKQMYIIIDYFYIYYLYYSFLKHIIDINLNTLTSMLNEKLTKIVEIGYNNLLGNKENIQVENDNDKYFNMNIDILLNAPILLLPLNSRDQYSTKLIYVSLGQLKINSELADEKDKNSIYDKYIINFSNINIKTLKKFNNKEIIKDEYGEELIYPSSFNIDIDNYIYKSPKLEHKNKENFAPVLINIVMNDTKFSLSEDQIIFLIDYLENFKRVQFEFEKKESKNENEIKNGKVNNKKNEEKIEKKEKKEEKENKNEIKDQKIEIKEGNNKIKEVTNIVKISIKFGEVQMILIKNLVTDEQLEINKKIKFLSFYFRESTLYFLMKSNNSMNMNISFGHFYLYDEDSKLDEQQKEVSYINPEFKCIIGTSSYGIKDKNNNNIKFSEIYNFKNDPNLKESIKIEYRLNAENNDTRVEISMCKLTISPNFSTLFRVYIFLNKYLDLYNKSMDRIKYSKLSDNIKVEKKEEIKIDDSTAPPPINIIENNNIKDEKIIKIKEHSVINVLFEMKGIDIYFPLEYNSHNTSLIFMTIETPIKYIMETDAEIELSSSKLKKINYKLRSSQIIIDIKRGNFSIYEFRDDLILLNSINQIYDNIDLTFLLHNNLDNNNKLNKFHIILQMNENIEISVNINHIIVFVDLYNKLFSFLDDIDKEELNVKIKENNELEDDEEIRRATIRESIRIKEKNKNNRKLKNKENKKINVFNYNKKFTYEFIITDISMKFYDIIDGIYQPLFEFLITKNKIEFQQNNKPKDIKNFKKYLVNAISNGPDMINSYDIYNLYMYLKIETHIEIKSLNNYLNQWEYFIEPFSINFYFWQLYRRMRPSIELFIPEMLNMNLSLNFAKILQFTIRKFSLNKEEIQKKKEQTLYNSEIISKNRHYLGYESPILILENYTGVDMEIWFDNIKYNNSNKDLIIKLKNKQKLEITNGLLIKYKVKKQNNNLNSTISYKLCFDEEMIYNSNLGEKNLIGNYFNINYHHIEIHDITEFATISIESCSDNLLCRHIIFNSLISIKNETKYKDIQLCNNDNTQKINLNDNQRQTVPISWFLYNKNKNINLLFNNDSQILMKNLIQINQINKSITFNNKDSIFIDVIKYKINLKEFYANKSTDTIKKNIFRVDIILSSPINLINNTPYELIINENNTILPTKSLDIYRNFNYLSNINIVNEKEITLKILKDIRLELIYDNKILSVSKYIEEKNGFDVDKTVEGKKINNFSSYNKNLSILLKEDITKTFLICRIFFNNPYESISYNNKIYESMKIELNSFKYEIIFDYYFVNRTNLNLYFNNIKNVISKDYNVLIPAKKYIPVSKLLLNKKVKLRIYNNDNWSNIFESSALGEEFILNIQKDNINYNSVEVKIRISQLFNKSITFIIEDKFIVINNLPFDINLKENNLCTITNIKSNENKLLLLNEESLNQKNNYRIGIGKCYSNLFDIDKLGSYDLLIQYNQKVFEEKNIDIEGKLIELSSGKKFLPIRCIINTINKSTIYILFSFNKNYINQLKNCAPQNIEVVINQDNQQKYLVKPEMTIPLIYFNSKGRYEPFDKVKIIFNKETYQIVSLNELSTKYVGKNKDFVIKVQPENNNSVKCITIYNKNDRRLKEEHDDKKKIKKYSNITGLKMKLTLTGIGISIIDESPKEIFYFSLYDISFDYKFSKITNILKEIEIYNSITFLIKNIQLDYCLDNAYDIVFNPINQILPKKQNEKDKKKDKNFFEKVLEDEEDNTPFFQFVISQKIKIDNSNDKNKLIYSINPQIAIIIQEFDVRINTILINSLIKVVNQYIQIFLPSNDEINEINKISDNNDNGIKIEDSNLLIDKYDDQYFIKIKENLLNKAGNKTNLVINNLTLSAIKVNTTFKVNKNAIEIRYVPGIIITLINTLCSTLSSFSDVTLKLKEISFINVFSDFDSLNNKLMNYYKNQILAQIYKIILNIDILGNPINLLEGVGTGIFQLFNEPRKGLLKGPEEFGIGLTRGARALVSNVVGGGFNSVSKITGTLLNASKNLSSMGTEEEMVVKEEEKPKGLFKGALSGFKKGFGELTHGVAGLVTKPIEQTQKGGVGGFFKGLGSGLMGAVLAPVNTVLTVGNEVTSGISNSEFISNKKSLRRFRIPRTLYKYLPIYPYDEIKEMKRKKQREEIDESDVIIISLSNEKLYLENSTEIIMVEKLYNGNNLIFTNVMIKIMDNQCSNFIKKIYVCDIKKAEENNNYIQLIMKNETIEKFKFKEEKIKEIFITRLNKFLS